MATKIEAYQATDGSLHHNACDASRRDIEIMLSGIPLAENSPCLKKTLDWLCQNADKAAVVLLAYAAACPQDAPGIESPENEKGYPLFPAKKDPGFDDMEGDL